MAANQRPKQMRLFPREKRAHGGDLVKGSRKGVRPFSARLAQHFVMRASCARGQLSMLKPAHKEWIKELLYRLADQYGIEIKSFANVGNHLHILLRSRTKEALTRFLRLFSGQIAQRITGATRAQPFGKFWDKLVYSRLVAWGRDYESVHFYIGQNLFEAGGWNKKWAPEFKRWFTQLKSAGMAPPG